MSWRKLGKSGCIYNTRDDLICEVNKAHKSHDALINYIIQLHKNELERKARRKKGKKK